MNRNTYAIRKNKWAFNRAWVLQGTFKAPTKFPKNGPRQQNQWRRKRQNYRVRTWSQLLLKEIADKIGRSVTVVRNFLKLGESYGKKSSTGRPRRLTNLDTLRIVREAKIIGKRSSSIKKSSQLECSARTIRRYLSDDPSLKYKKVLAVPAMKTKNKKKRVK